MKNIQQNAITMLIKYRESMVFLNNHVERRRIEAKISKIIMRMKRSQ